MQTEIIHAMVAHVLENAHKYEWNIQGFGMLRTYLPNDLRLNIWNRRFRVPDVSLIHTHPWHFDSYIERGTLHNQRFEVGEGKPNYSFAKIKPGPGGGLIEPAGIVRLRAMPYEHYFVHDVYHQQAEEIHLSDPGDGCVTINARTRIGPDEAFVYWPVGTDWVSAEPRKATKEEIEAFVLSARRISWSERKPRC